MTNPASPRKTVLLVEDEKIIRDALKKLLEKQGFEVAVAENGKTAQDLLALRSFDIVLSDIYMPSSPVSGLQLLHKIKSAGATPVILMTGFGALSETKEAFSAGASGFLAKPFKPDELLEAIHKACGTEGGRPAQEDGQDDQYCKLGIDDFISGRRIQYNIFIRISSHKYVKIAHKGEDIALDQIRAYKSKGIRHLHLQKNDFHEYMKFNLGLAQAIQLNTQISMQKKAHLLKHTGELVLEHLYSNEIEQEAFQDAKSVVDTTISFMADSRESIDLLDALNSHSDALYAHCLGVSLYSTLIAHEMSWRSPTTRHKIAMAGLLHDIGLKEIDRAILHKPRSTLCMDELKSYETHTIRGMEILSQNPAIPEDVLQVVLQHHERDRGQGYPSGLLKGKTHPLSRLIAVADEFCDLALKNASNPGLSPREAAHRLVMLCGNTLDAGFMRALFKVLKIESVVQTN